MTTGMVFDIREFTIHDGPGIRTTVFMKGCPLTCQWCHNPESQSALEEVLVTPTGVRKAGTGYPAEVLAGLLNRQAAILNANEGGVTFSGGEPLLQAGFIAEVIDQLEGIHIVLDTSGYGNPQGFRQLLSRTDLVYYDLKLIDAEAHRRYTGCDNDLILANLEILGKSGVPFVIRVPLVPGVTDQEANLKAIARIAANMPGLLRVDLLPYNRSAGAKYESLGRKYRPDFNEAQSLNINLTFFEELGVKVLVN